MLVVFVHILQTPICLSLPTIFIRSTPWFACENDPGFHAEYVSQSIKVGQCTLTIKEICCHQQLQAQLRRDVHIGYILSIPVLVVVVEVFSYLFEDDATIKRPRLVR